MSTLLPPPHPCGEELRQRFARHGIDVTVATTPPRIALYDLDTFTCPHRITYWPQPTDAQIAQWRKDGTR